MKRYGVNTRNTMSKEFVNDNLDLILSLMKMDAKTDRILNISADDIRNLKIKEIGLKYNLSKLDQKRLRLVLRHNKIEYKCEEVIRIDYSGIDFKNKTLSEISEETGIPYDTLKYHCRVNNIEFKHNFSSRFNAKYDYSGIDFKNKTLKEISEETGIPYKRLNYYCHKNGIEFKCEEVFRIDYSKIDFKNKTLKEISEETGISYDTLMYHCRVNNIEFKRCIPTTKKNT